MTVVVGAVFPATWAEMHVCNICVFYDGIVHDGQVCDDMANAHTHMYVHAIYRDSTQSSIAESL